jgi:hypothetical protein
MLSKSTEAPFHNIFNRLMCNLIQQCDTQNLLSKFKSHVLYKDENKLRIINLGAVAWWIKVSAPQPRQHGLEHKSGQDHVSSYETSSG